MKNKTLFKRHYRQLKNDFSKWLGLAIYFIIIFAFGSSYVMSSNLMAEENTVYFIRQNVEDGSFKMQKALSANDLLTLKNMGLIVENQSYKDLHLKSAQQLGKFFASDKILQEDSRNKTDKKADKELSLRCFRQRKIINKAYVPTDAGYELNLHQGQVAVDSLLAEKLHLKTGDKISVGNKDLKIAAKIYLPDYLVVTENIYDFPNEQLNFSFIVLADEDYEQLAPAADADRMEENYNYAYVYQENYQNIEKIRKLSFAQLQKAGAEHLAAKEKLSPAQTKLRQGLLQYLKQEKIAKDKRNNTLNNFLEYKDNYRIRYGIEKFSLSRNVSLIFIFMGIFLGAFLIAVISNQNLYEEARIIGVLLATGYKKREIFRHYLFLPSLLSVFSGVVGLFLGVELLSDYPVKNLFKSVKLPSITGKVDPLFLSLAFFVPLLVLVLINSAFLWKFLKLSPLRLIRADIGKHFKGRGIKLKYFSFYSRFSIRIFLRNKFSFLMLCSGIFLSSILFLYALGINRTISDINKDQDLVAEHQYVLKNSLYDYYLLHHEEDIEDKVKAYADELKNGDFARKFLQEKTVYLYSLPPAQIAEARVKMQEELQKKIKEEISAYTESVKKDTEAQALKFEKDILSSARTELMEAYFFSLELHSERIKEGSVSNQVNLYALNQKSDSKYFSDFNTDELAEDECYASVFVRDKYGLKEGDFVHLLNPAGNLDLHLKIKAFVPYKTGLNFFVSRAYLYPKLIEENDTDSRHFRYNLLISNFDLPIPTDNIVTVIDKKSIDETASAFAKIMQSTILTILCISIMAFFVVIYLLTKLMIEKNALNISLMKVFGYTYQEIKKFYLNIITIFTILSLLVFMPLEARLLHLLWPALIAKIPSYFPYRLDWADYMLSIVVGLLSYTFVFIICKKKLNKISMTEALKARE